MAKFNVYILAHWRPKVIEIQSHFLKKIKNKDKIKVWIMATGKDGDCDSLYRHYAKDLNDNGIQCDINITPTGNYMQKIHFAQTQESEYSVKFDEDLWFNENVWDFIIENADSVLSDPDNLVLSPILTNGIPTCDLFCEDFFTEEEYSKIKQYALTTDMGEYWGVKYKNYLNKDTVFSKNWRPDLFYQSVSQIPHFYKGIHPVRINYLMNKCINDLVLNNFSKFANVEKSKMFAQTNDSPYLCNSVFVIKTDLWRKIINDKSLYRDDFDEVPLNLYKQNNKLKWVFIRNGYCFHTIYNTVWQPEYELKLIDDCVNLIRTF